MDSLVINNTSIPSFSQDTKGPIGVPLYSILYGDYKFNINAEVWRNNSIYSGSVSIYQGDKLIFSGYTGGRGHTIFVFDPFFNLVNKTTYDSYGQGNTNNITNVLNSYSKNHLFIIISQDAITNDATFANTIAQKFNTSITQCSETRAAFYFIGTQNYGRTGYSLTPNPINKTLYSSVSYNHVFSNFTDSVNHNNWHNINLISNINTLQKGYTYYFSAMYRNRAELGKYPASTPCFIYWTASNSTWTWSASFTDWSLSSNQIIHRTYNSYTPTENINLQGAALFSALINAAYDNGCDNQTIDLYYYDLYYKDTAGNFTRIACDGTADTSTFPAVPNQAFFSYYKDEKIYYVPAVVNDISRTNGAVTYSTQSSNLKFKFNGLIYTAVKQINKSF